MYYIFYKILNINYYILCIMVIKHIVISGGGPVGLNFLGALKYLNEQQFWLIENIENIYATSVGTIIAIFLCLNYDWETLYKYIIERPWHDAFIIKGKHILEAYSSKGLYDRKLADIIFKPLLEAKDLSLSITLKEFYEYTKIFLHLYTFELNQFKTIELSHINFPNLPLMEAITMSCALPGLFIPTCRDNCCYMDGGVMDNYPLNFCLNNGHNKDEILGIKYQVEHSNSIITNESNILDFAIGFFINAMNYISSKHNAIETINNEIVCIKNESIMSLDKIKESVKNSEMRKIWILDGEKIGETFLNLKKDNNAECDS